MGKSDKELVVMRVAANSGTHSVAAALTGFVREKRDIELIAIGAGAVNQMMKATCIARGRVAEMGLDMSFTSGFRDETVSGERLSAICIRVRIK